MRMSTKNTETFQMWWDIAESVLNLVMPGSNQLEAFTCKVLLHSQQLSNMLGTGP